MRTVLPGGTHKTVSACGFGRLCHEIPIPFLYREPAEEDQGLPALCAVILRWESWGERSNSLVQAHERFSAIFSPVSVCIPSPVAKDCVIAMEIQSIPGFKLSSRTVTASGGPPSRVIRRGGFNGHRSQTEVRTLDFSRGLEVYVPPRIVKRPTSSQRKSRIKTPSKNDGKDSRYPTPNKEKENDLQIPTNARCCERSEVLEQEQRPDSRPSDAGPCYTSGSPEGIEPVRPDQGPTSQTTKGSYCRVEGQGEDIAWPVCLDPSNCCQIACTKNKAFVESSGGHRSKGWFERTLQEYEVLKKSVEAHISTTPSSERGDSVAESSYTCVPHIWEELSREDTGLSDGYIETQNFEKYLTNDPVASNPMRQEKVGSRSLWEQPLKSFPAKHVSPGIGAPWKKRCGGLTTFSCGCSAKRVVPVGWVTYCCSCPPEVLANLGLLQKQLVTSEETEESASRKQLMETVDHLRQANRRLEQTVKELKERECKLASSRNMSEDAGTFVSNREYEEVSMNEPKLRKQVLRTLKNSVQRMESLMLALKEEQDKSKKLSVQLQGFLSSSKERTPHRSPTRSVPWSREVSPDPPTSTSCCYLRKARVLQGEDLSPRPSLPFVNTELTSSPRKWSPWLLQRRTGDTGEAGMGSMRSQTDLENPPRAVDAHSSEVNYTSLMPSEVVPLASTDSPPSPSAHLVTTQADFTDFVRRGRRSSKVGVIFSI